MRDRIDSQMTGRDVPGSHRQPSRFGAVAGIAMTIVGVLSFALVSTVVITLVAGAADRPAASAPAGSAPAASAPVGASPAEADEQAAAPVRVRIPAIDIDAAVGPLLVDENGVLPPPDSFEETGWWKEGPEPGEVGPAVIAGHVDSYKGPAVFFELDEIDAGDKIFVDRADGTTVVFVAQRTERHPKAEFPTEAVYGDTPNAQLRLITCGGAFNETERTYLDNVIVFATQAS